MRIKKQLTAVLLLCFSFVLQGEDRPMFELYCALESSDLVVSGRFNNDEGTFTISDILFGATLSSTLYLGDFASPRELETIGIPENLTNQEAILFIDFDESGIARPAFWNWDISSLWKHEEVLKGAFTYDTVTRYQLKEYFRDIDQLNVQINAWSLLNQILEQATEIDRQDLRLSYLANIFDWHPSKNQIIALIAEEGPAATIFLEDMLKKVSQTQFLSREEINVCAWDFDHQSYYLSMLNLYFDMSSPRYDLLMFELVNQAKGNLLSPSNRDFTRELFTFLNEHPSEAWSIQKQEMAAILESYQSSHNDSFYKTIKWILTD